METIANTSVPVNRGARKAVSAAAVLASAWPALLLATVCLLPFLNKAFNIDDPWFLTMAQQIVKHPAHPMDFSECWNTGVSDQCRKASQFASGNPLLGEVGQGYALVPAVLGGAHEWMAHLTQLVLAWIAILAMTSLVFRFGWDRWHATFGALLLVAIPPFLPMASTAMPDVLATALAALGMERLAAWKAEHKWDQGAAAAVGLGLAGFARPHLVLLLPLAAFFLLDSTSPREILTQFRRKSWLWTPVVAGSGLTLICILALRERNLAISYPATAMVWKSIPINLSAYLLYLTFPLPLTACWLANRLGKKRLGGLIVIFLFAACAGIVSWGARLPVFLAFIGGAALCGLLLESWQKRDHTSLFLLLWILLPLPAAIYLQLPIKLLLPCVPAIILLGFRLTERFSLRVTRAITIALIVASTGYSLLIIRSDAEFAAFGRDALHELITPHIAAGETVWYPGQYWSYWYAPLDGAKLTFAGGPQPRSGDLLVVDVFAAGLDTPVARFPHRTLVDTITHKYRFGRTMGAGMGLYSDRSGFWLWGFGSSDKDRFELWRID